MIDRRKFTRSQPEERKTALIEATLRIIAAKGLSAATVRDISAEAGVTQGLIRHYFDSKDDLIKAAYEHHMISISDAALRCADDDERSAVARLIRFLSASLEPPVMDAIAVGLWAGFLDKVRHDAHMHAIHNQTYHYFRNILEQMISDAYAEIGVSVPARRVQQLATASNAVIDGLWMEGGVLPELFEPGEISRIGIESVGAILQINLTQEAAADATE